MKKIIALALALIMALSMASVAFAQEAATTATPIDFDIDACPTDCGVLDDVITEHLLPGEAYELGVAADLTDGDKYNGKSWKIDADWTVGGALVDEIYWDKEAGDDEKGDWVLVLNENYTIAAAKRLEGTITFEPKGVAKKTLGDAAEALEYTVDVEVSNHVIDVYGEEDADDVVYADAEDNTIYVCVEDEAGYVGFNSGKLLSVLCDLESEEKVFAYNDEELIEALAEKFPEADIECYNFGSVRALQNEAELTLQADYADQYYVYTYNKGVLEAQNYTWNSVDGVYEWNTKTLGSFVISDVELVAAEEEPKNPDTGANDVVGVAAALAVVSLVAGAAVSLKK